MSKRLKAVVFDWAGTTIDFGCRAPLQVILNIFKDKGLPITIEEAIKPMGILKIEHFRELFRMERIKEEYKNKFNKIPDEKTIEDFYSEFEPELFKILPNFSEPIPDVVKTIEILRNKYNLKIGSTTGYTEEMMKYVSPIAEKKGYRPDYLITSSEVPQGRPLPWMMYQNAINLGIYPMETMIKVGDTVADIMEGRNAGSWSVGVVEGSSLLGYTLDEFNQEDKNIIKKKKEEVIKIFNENKADFVINSFKDLPEIIEKINVKLNQNEYPGNKLEIPSQPYSLFTPGPITTSTRVKLPMMTDWGSRENDYLEVVESIRKELVNLALLNSDSQTLAKNYTTVIIPGSGTFGVESCISSVIPKNGKFLVISNGQYGLRMSKISKLNNISTIDLEFKENEIPDVNKIDEILTLDKDITHVGMIHSETTTGILNPLKEIGNLIKKFNKVFIVDAMSSFGAIPLDIKEMNINYLITSSNKNLQGVPGISLVIADRKLLENCKNIKKNSLSLDLYDQWDYLEKTKGGFRFTSPVHVIRSFYEALNELRDEGGINKRFKRYSEMQRLLLEGMHKLNFKNLDLKGNQGPIITTFLNPKDINYDFERFYKNLKDRNCVIYPGKLTKVDSFRIGTIGHLNVNNIKLLLEKVEESIFWDNSLN